MKLKTFTVDDIRNLAPCYDPVTGADDDGNVLYPGGFVSENWTGTALDVLKINACPVEDRLWVVFHKGWIDDRALRLFAVWCAREALRLADEPDLRSVAACNTAERYAFGAATDQELTAARDAARDAARIAARGAAWVAARNATWTATWAAVWAVAEDATSAATWAAKIAAEAAARAAAWDATWAAWDSAWAAARESQIKRLIVMLEADDRKAKIEF